MWYLLLQILLLMLLAALAGAALAYWWMRNRYEDVTDTYEELMISGAEPSGPPPVTREELAAHFAGIEERLSALPVPVTRDELHANINSISERVTRLPMPDISPLGARLEAIEAGWRRPARPRAWPRSRTSCC